MPNPSTRVRSPQSYGPGERRWHTEQPADGQRQTAAAPATVHMAGIRRAQQPAQNHGRGRTAAPNNDHQEHRARTSTLHSVRLSTVPRERTAAPATTARRTVFAEPERTPNAATATEPINAHTDSAHVLHRSLVAATRTEQTDPNAGGSARQPGPQQATAHSRSHREGLKPDQHRGRPYGQCTTGRRHPRSAGYPDRQSFDPTPARTEQTTPTRTPPTDTTPGGTRSPHPKTSLPGRRYLSPGVLRCLYRSGPCNHASGAVLRLPVGLPGAHLSRLVGPGSKAANRRTAPLVITPHGRNFLCLSVRISGRLSALCKV